MKLKITSFLILILFTGLTCKKSSTQTAPLPTPTAFFAKGADVGWLTQMENAGVKF